MFVFGSLLFGSNVALYCCTFVVNFEQIFQMKVVSLLSFL